MDTTTDDGNATPIFDFMMSPYHTSTLLVFARLGLFDFIHSKDSVSVEQLAARANWSIRATSAMMVSLVTNNLLCVVEENGSTVHSFKHHYKLTPRATKFLLVDAPGSVVPYLELFWDCSPKQLMEKASAKKAQDNFMLETGGGAPSEMFINAMQGQTSHASMTLAPLLVKDELSQTTHFVDVAGGSGVFCIEVCKNRPETKGTIYELEGVCPIAEKYITKSKLNDRVQAIPGNMFKDEVFPEADCYGFGNVLHDWSDETNKALLQKAFKSLPPTNGKVVLLEMLVAENVSSTTRATAGLNLVMVTNEDGRQYKASELKDMLEGVGFVDFKVVTSPLTPYSAIVASKLS